MDELTGGERERRAERGRELAARLRRLEAEAVAVTWVDTSGITRVKGVPTGRLGHAAAWGVGSSPVFDLFLLDDSMVPGTSPAGDLRLHPDLERLTAKTALPGWAWAPGDRYDQSGRAHPRDGRALLRRECARLAEDGWRVRAGIEVEWVVSEGEDFTPACTGPAYGMARLAELPEYLGEILRALAASGVTVEQIHPEYIAGQFELSTAEEDPVGAADTAVLVRETVRAVSGAHGLRVSFSPKVSPGLVGNGGHIHLSLWQGDTPMLSGGGLHHGLTHEGAAFTAGILRRLPALLAVGAPSAASYLRLVPAHWAGAYACWGLENREAAVRLVSPPLRPRCANIEVKCFDATANPYLALAALLAAGRDGLATSAPLPPPVDGAPSPENAKRLPETLLEAVSAFESDPFLPSALGAPMSEALTAVRRAEAALFADADPAAVVTRTRWRH